MTEEKNVLIANAKEYLRNAANAEKNRDYNAAATLYFKSFVSLLDYFIYLNEGSIPSSHSNRFRILEKSYPELYKKADSDFGLYQRSYKERLDKEACEVIRNDAKKLFESLKIKV